MDIVTEFSAWNLVLIVRRGFSKVVLREDHLAFEELCVRRKLHQIWVDFHSFLDKLA